MHVTRCMYVSIIKHLCINLSASVKYVSMYVCIRLSASLSNFVFYFPLYYVYWQLIIWCLILILAPYNNFNTTCPFYLHQHTVFSFPPNIIIKHSTYPHPCQYTRVHLILYTSMYWSYFEVASTWGSDTVSPVVGGEWVVSVVMIQFWGWRQTWCLWLRWYVIYFYFL